MFKTFIALIKIFFFMLGKRKQLKLAKKYDRQGNIAERDKIVKACVPGWAQYVFKVCHSDVIVEGAEKLPKDRAVVFIANHQGAMDIPALFGYIDKPMTFVAKAELGKIPVLADWMKMLQCTFIERKSPRKSVQAIHDAAEGVKKGYSQVIFPEGTRSRGFEHNEFKAGSFKLAFMSKAPIVPVTIDGTWKIYEENKRLCPGQVKLTIHDPIETADLTREQQQEIPARVEQIVCSILSEPRKRIAE